MRTRVAQRTAVCRKSAGRGALSYPSTRSSTLINPEILSKHRGHRLFHQRDWCVRKMDHLGGDGS